MYKCLEADFDKLEKRIKRIIKKLEKHDLKYTFFIHTDNVVGRDNMYETLLGAQRRGFIDKNIKIYRYGYIH